MFPHIVELINHTEIRVELVKGGFLNYWHSPKLGVLTHKNIAKGTTDPRIEFGLPKLLLKVISQVLTQILFKFQLQNLDQASTSKSEPNISLSIKLKLQNLDQPSTELNKSLAF